MIKKKRFEPHGEDYMGILHVGQPLLLRVEGVQSFHQSDSKREGGVVVRHRHRVPLMGECPFLSSLLRPSQSGQPTLSFGQSSPKISQLTVHSNLAIASTSKDSKCPNWPQRPASITVLVISTPHFHPLACRSSASPDSQSPDLLAQIFKCGVLGGIEVRARGQNPRVRGQLCSFIEPY